MYCWQSVDYVFILDSYWTIEIKKSQSVFMSCSLYPINAFDQWYPYNTQFNNTYNENFSHSLYFLEKNKMCCMSLVIYICVTIEYNRWNLFLSLFFAFSLATTLLLRHIYKQMLVYDSFFSMACYHIFSPWTRIHLNA